MTHINVNAVDFVQYDQLERIYARIMPKTSPAFSEEGGQGFAGSKGGDNVERLNMADILSAVGWMEKKHPSGGELLRAVFTDNPSEAARTAVTAVQLYGWPQMIVNPTERVEIAIMALREHIERHTIQRCKKCKGQGIRLTTNGAAVCQTCNGDGHTKFEVKTNTRLRKLKRRRVDISRRKWEGKVQPMYLELLVKFAELERDAGDFLINILKKPS